MKKSLNYFILIGLLGFLVMNFNIYLILGTLLGLFWRLYHGSSISFAIGLTLGIIVAELCKFITYKL